MIVPVRCFTCGKVLSDKWLTYEKMSKDASKDEKGEILDKLKITKLCCRIVMLTTVDMTDIL